MMFKGTSKLGTKDWVKENQEKIELFFLPAYSPEKNPDEYLNCDLKQPFYLKNGKNKPSHHHEFCAVLGFHFIFQLSSVLKVGDILQRDSRDTFHRIAREKSLMACDEHVVEIQDRIVVGQRFLVINIERDTAQPAAAQDTGNLFVRARAVHLV